MCVPELTTDTDTDTERERERVRVRERDRVSEVSMVNDWPVVYRTQPLKMGCT